jgi:bacterioferritin-associated ferredoxin
MIICSCNVLADHEIQELAETALQPLDARLICNHLGCTMQCGRCARGIKQTFDEAFAGCRTGCARWPTGERHAQECGEPTIGRYGPKKVPYPIATSGLKRWAS